MQHIDLGATTQLAWVTRDMEASLNRFARDLGIGPWFVLPKAILPRTRFLGEPCEIEMIVAFANTCGLEFEMMQQTNAAPSIWSDGPAGDALDALHHSCVRPPNYVAALTAARAAGYAVEFEGETQRGHFSYVRKPGAATYVELLEDSPSRRAMHALVRDAAARWDGSDPVRPMPAV